MTTVPVELPVTTPVEEPTVDMVPEVLQVPPVLSSVSVVVSPRHTTGMPVIEAGNGFTVIVEVVTQPVVVIYLIVVVPLVMPVVMPVADPIAAVPTLSLSQVPPVVASCNVMSVPTHTLKSPVIDGGGGSTVTVVFTAQPVPNE